MIPWSGILENPYSLISPGRRARLSNLCFHGPVSSSVLILGSGIVLALPRWVPSVNRTSRFVIDDVTLSMVPCSTPKEVAISFTSAIRLGVGELVLELAFPLLIWA